jgi:hypothetical protein
MIANNTNLSTALGITYNVLPPERTEVIEPAGNTDIQKAENDYEFARRNLYDIIEQGQTALEDMIDFAKQAQHPRAYEVVGTLINNLVDANQKLLNLSKQVKEIKKAEAGVQEPGTVNNNLFVGSTAEMLKLLKGD